MNGDKIIEAIGMIDEELIAEADKKSFKKRINKKIALSLIAALVVFSALGITSFAKTYYGASLDEALYMFFPSVAQSLEPVNLSCEDNGIKMEVVSANIKDNKSYIYVSMQDMTDDRIDESIDLYDSYRLKIPGDQHGACTKIGYDEESGKATFLVNINSDDNTIPKGKVTLSIGCFLSQKLEQEGFIDEIDLTKAELFPEYETDVTRYKRLKDKYEPGSLKNNIYRFAYERIPRVVQNMLNLNDGYFEYEYYDEETENYLSKTGDSFYTSETGAEFVAMGFIDDKLHIKVFYGSRHYNDHIGFLTIFDKNGKEIHSTNMKYIDNFGEVEPNLFAPKETWVDYCFDISPKEIEGCRLYGEFWIYENYTEGDWEVTFRLP